MNQRQPDFFIKPDGRTALLMPSGFILDLLTPDAADMPIDDIAQSLAAQPRWGGAAKPWYSVAEHSVMVSHLVHPSYALDALMHDAEEFIGDWPTPVKILMGTEYVKRKLRPIKEALGRRFGFAIESTIVKRADEIAMATELRDLLPPAWMEWGHLPDPHREKIVPVGPERAYELFLKRYEEVKHLAKIEKTPGKKKTRGTGK